MTESIRNTLLLVVAGLLAACNTTERLQESTAWQVRQSELNALEHWQLQGRVNARYQGESHTPRIRWQQAAAQYSIRLWGTLNAGATLIEGRPGFVTFEQGNDIYNASTPEDLILEHLGYELPVSELNFWIRGLPNPGQEHRLELGEFNELVSLEQAGWTMHYEDYRIYGDYSLPRRIEMARPENDIRLVFIGLNWTVGEELN